MIKSSDLKVKDVINISDGRRLGTISDIEIDVDKGELTALIVPGAGGLFGIFSRGDDMVIPWHKIHKIGLDVILVEMTAGSDYKKLNSNEKL
ncbi:MAG: YlmC/YmxH family sporulation protein [Sporomusaceae bacterium]|nr:YlmC/YmxH family sporulation protein [Sporomusaceae bacterium]